MFELARTNTPTQVALSPFLVCLVRAPLLVALLGFWMVNIPVFALVLGAPTYLLFGGPAFYLTICQGASSPMMHMMAGVMAHIVSIPAMVLYFGINERAMNGISVMVQFSFVFAPLWGLTFGFLYRATCAFAGQKEQVRGK